MASVDPAQNLPLMEEFLTLQGEGAHTGSSAYFLRIGGCDVGCHWCDVKESWNAELHPVTPLEQMVQNAVATGSPTVVVTGGEPLMWNMGPLTDALHDAGLQVHLETSGAYPMTGTWDWICLSPKKTKAPRSEWYAVAHELKVIVFNNDDFRWAEVHAQEINRNAQRFLQPEWSKRDKALPDIIAYIEQNPTWRLSLQTHKYIGLP
jgi:7-carboxy-7-deazaguanine synthase